MESALCWGDFILSLCKSLQDGIKQELSKENTRCFWKFHPPQSAWGFQVHLEELASLLEENKKCSCEGKICPAVQDCSNNMKRWGK